MSSDERWTAEKEAFDRDGFVIVRQFLGRDELTALGGELDRYIRDVVPGLPETSAFYQDRARPETLKQLQHMAVDPFFRDYVRHSKWTSLAAALVGELATCEQPEWFNKPPGVAHPTPPHQDNYYFCLKPPNVVTIWLALDAVGEENGCLRYVRGSHAAGLRPHARSAVLGFSQAISDYGPDDQARETPIYLQPGDVVAHHGEAIHRAEPNRSPVQQRRAFAMVFRGVSCRRDDEAFARYQSSLKRQHESLGVGS